jgi:hypothetical protein
MSITAESTAVSTRYVSSEKSAWPGVSSRLMTAVRYGNCNTVDVIEMPLAFSISIQSDTVARRPALPWTAPASVMTRACSASASVNVDLPASGWLMTAKVLRRPASAEIRTGCEVSAVGGAARALSVIASAMVLAPEGKPVIGRRACSLTRSAVFGGRWHQRCRYFAIRSRSVGHRPATLPRPVRGRAGPGPPTGRAPEQHRAGSNSG